MSINKIFKNNNGQIVILTIFIILISFGMTLILFMPVNQEVIKLRKLLNTFQSITYGESGVEFANYYAIKDKNIGNFSISFSDTIFENSQCQIFVKKVFSNPPGFTNCYYIKMSTSTNISEIEIYNSVLIKDDLIEKIYLKSISLGNYKKIQRSLDFDFYP